MVLRLILIHVFLAALNTVTWVEPRPYRRDP